MMSMFNQFPTGSSAVWISLRSFMLWSTMIRLSVVNDWLSAWDSQQWSSRQTCFKPLQVCPSPIPSTPPSRMWNRRDSAIGRSNFSWRQEAKDCFFLQPTLMTCGQTGSFATRDTARGRAGTSPFQLLPAFLRRKNERHPEALDASAVLHRYLHPLLRQEVTD